MSSTYVPPITAGSLATEEARVAYLGNLYRRAEASLAAELESLAERLAVDDDPGVRFRRRVVADLNRKVSALAAELDDEAARWVQQSLPGIYAAGMARAGDPTWSLIHRRAVTAIATDTFDDLAGATRYMSQSAKQAIRRATKLAVGQRALEGAPLQGRTRRRVMDDLVHAGVTGFVDNGGRRWRLGSYADMVVRTKAAHAYNTGTVLKVEETGTRVVEVVDAREGPDADLPCVMADGKLASTLWALEHPVEHPNCVRSFAPRPLLDESAISPGYGSASDGKAASRVPDIPEDELLAVPDHRLRPDELDLAGQDLNRYSPSGLAPGTYKVPGGVRHGDLNLGPGRMVVDDRERFVYVEDRAKRLRPGDPVDLAHELLAGLDAATPTGLEESVRRIVVTVLRNSDDEYWSKRYGYEFRSAATSNGPTITYYGAGLRDPWGMLSTLRHETGHSIAHVLNRKARDGAEAAIAAARAKVAETAPRWLLDEFERLGLDPATVPVGTIEHLARMRATTLARRQMEEGNLSAIGASRYADEAEKALRAEWEAFVVRRAEVSGTPGVLGNGAAVGPRWLEDAKRDALRLSRMPKDKYAGAEWTEAVKAGHTLRLDGYGVWSEAGKEVRRPGVTSYGASVPDVEDWAESWRLYVADRVDGKLGTLANGKAVRFADLWPNRARFLEEWFELAGVDPTSVG